MVHRWHEALASRVFPVPGGPNSNTPRGGARSPESQTIELSTAVNLANICVMWCPYQWTHLVSEWEVRQSHSVSFSLIQDLYVYEDRIISDWLHILDRQTQSCRVAWISLTCDIWPRNIWRTLHDFRHDAFLSARQRMKGSISISKCMM